MIRIREPPKPNGPLTLHERWDRRHIRSHALPFGLRFEGVVLRRQLDEKVTFRAATCSAAPDCPGRGASSTPPNAVVLLLHWMDPRKPSAVALRVRPEGRSQGGGSVVTKTLRTKTCPAGRGPLTDHHPRMQSGNPRLSVPTKLSDRSARAAFSCDARERPPHRATHWRVWAVSFLAAALALAQVTMAPESRAAAARAWGQGATAPSREP